MCEEYLPLALKHLQLGGAHRDKTTPTTFDFGLEMMRVRFLFPGIAQAGFDALVFMRYWRWMNSLTKKIEQEENSLKAASQAEHVEAEYATNLAIVQKMTSSLSPVQGEIIRAHFV